MNNANQNYLIALKQKGCLWGHRLKNREEHWSSTLGVADTLCCPQHATCITIHQFNSPSVTGSLLVLSPETLTGFEKDDSPPVQKSCTVFTSKVKWRNSHLYLNPVMATVRTKPFTFHCCNQTTTNIHRTIFKFLHAQPQSNIPIQATQRGSLLFPHFIGLICHPTNMPN